MPATILAYVTSLPTGEYKADLDDGTRLGPFRATGEAQRAAEVIRGRLRWVRDDLAGGIEHWRGEKP